MKQKVLFIYFCLITMVPVHSQEAEIRAVIDKMFTAMYKADTAAMRPCFTPGATFMTYSFDSKGHPRAKGEALIDFFRGVGLMGEADMEERLIGWQCLIDDGIASVWTPYEFYFEGKFSHCGVNSFQLIKVQGIWKITMITDTRRKTSCPSDEQQVMVIDSLINRWHHAAAKADEEAFFGRMTEDGIYIGTDATERWLRDELKEWSKEYFKRETAWDFKPISRNVTIGPGGQIAWFDELLDTWMGTCRSTGIMERIDGEWKIIYYHLSVALPNDKMDGYRLLIGKN
jgi:ketosteroid isomerase-like protein